MVCTQLGYAIMDPLPLVSLRALHAELAPQLEPGARAWLEGALRDRLLLADPLRLRVAFAQVARKLGSRGELVDLARLALLTAALAERTPEQALSLIETLYETGEQREQESVLRALARLPQAARLGSVAIEACRTNSVAVFSALACDNPYPAAHFPELHFNQMVLKALFLGVPVARIAGLDTRKNAELSRMVRAYASERRAAGRPVPADVDFVIALCER